MCCCSVEESCLARLKRCNKVQHTITWTLRTTSPRFPSPASLQKRASRDRSSREPARVWLASAGVFPPSGPFPGSSCSASAQLETCVKILLFACPGVCDACAANGELAAATSLENVADTICVCPNVQARQPVCKQPVL